MQVKSGCAKGEKTARMKNVATVMAAPVPSSRSEPNALAR